MTKQDEFLIEILKKEDYKHTRFNSEEVFYNLESLLEKKINNKLEAFNLGIEQFDFYESDEAFIYTITCYTKEDVIKNIFPDKEGFIKYLKNYKKELYSKYLEIK
jgi:hypothetical protein